MQAQRIFKPQRNPLSFWQTQTEALTLTVLAIAVTNELERLDTPKRFNALFSRWQVGEVIATTSFGIQSAVLLHLLNQTQPGIRIVFIDTGYLFPETLAYAQLLESRWNLNLLRYSPAEPRENQERLYGKLWEQGADGLNHYNLLNKVEPMQRAIAELKPNVWISGLRRSQAKSRRNRQILEHDPDSSLHKFHPLADWTEKDVFFYQQKHQLPVHPLWAKGYVTVGDWHSSEPLQPGQPVEATRFHGIKRECGLHLTKFT